MLKAFINYMILCRTGDQILEYNGTDLRNATAEEAAYELAKPADKVTVVAQYNMDRKCLTFCHFLTKLLNISFYTIRVDQVCRKFTVKSHK